MLAGIDFRNVGPGWAEKAVAQLEADIAAGAVGVGEIARASASRSGKPTARGSARRSRARSGVGGVRAARIPVFIHTADPQEFFQPIDYHNERWLELALFPGRRYPPEQFPSFEQLMTERDNLFRRHPRTTFVTAHMGWHANDLGAAGQALDRAAERVHRGGCGAVRHRPAAARRARLLRASIQDRILFGKDSFQPEEYPYYWRVFETRDEYFDYYRDYHAFWKLYGIDLPDAVLKKVYYQNALRIVKGLPKAGFPQ